MKASSAFHAMLRPWLRGALAAASTLGAYAVALGLYDAFMLLIIAMDEGGESLAGLTIPMTQAGILLTQGVAFRVAGVEQIVVGVTPLLLSIALWALLAWMHHRWRITWHSLLAGLIIWEVLNEFCVLNAGVLPTQPDWAVLIKTGAFYLIGFALSMIPRAHGFVDRCSMLIAMLLQRLGLSRAAQSAAHNSADPHNPHNSHNLHDSHDLRTSQLTNTAALVKAVLRTWRLTLLAFCIAYTLLATLILLGWFIAQHHLIYALAQHDGMKTGSLVMVLITCCMWLPNLLAWAWAWMLGADIHIGDGAHYALAATHAQQPSTPIPILGILPTQPMSVTVQTLLTYAPLAISMLVGIGMLCWSPVRVSGWKMPPLHEWRKWWSKQAMPSLLTMLATLISFTLLASVVWFAASGSLGSGHLRHVGITVIIAVQALSHSMLVGFAAAWGVALIVLFSQNALRRGVQVHAVHYSKPKRSAQGTTRVAPRTASSSVVHATQTHEGKHTDESTGETHPRIRISQNRH